MIDINGIYLTEEGKREKEEELRKLENEVLPEIVQRIKIAREQGDLSENAEYKFAKDEQGKISTRIEELKELLKFAKIIKHTGGDTVNLGSTVTFYDIEMDEESTVTILGTTEANGDDKVSNESPLGKALLGKKVGDKATVVVSKDNTYEIEVKAIKG